MKNLVLFLNGERGLKVLEALVLAGHHLVAVVTPPNLDLSLTKVLTEGRFWSHLEVSDVNDPLSVGRLRSLNPLLFIVAGYSTIFRAPLLEVPELGTLNLHAGKLPEYRGGSPLNWQLINGEDQAGISVLHADAGIDTGPVLASGFIPIDSTTTIADLHSQANAMFPRLVLDAIASIEAGTTGAEQLNSCASYWHQRNDADGKLDIRSMTARQVNLFVRALSQPYPGAWCIYEEEVLRIFSVEVPEFDLRGVPGRICFIQGHGPYVVCADRAVLLTDYKLEDQKNVRLRHGTYLQ